MTDVSIRDLRNNGGEVVDRAARGEQITITRSGKPVAELRPLRRLPLRAEELVARRKGLQPVDSRNLREELDQVIDQSI